MKKQNWEISYEHHLKKYSEIDPQQAAVRTNITFNTDLSHFILNNLGHTLYAKWPEFNLSPADPDNCPKTLYNVQAQVLVMRVLYLGVYTPTSGTFKAYRELPWGDVYDPNFNGRCIKRFAYSFGFKPEAYKKAAEQLSGTKVNQGDIAYDFKVSGDITCRFILWKPDEEFPPSAQILFSDNAPLMYNAEDLAAIGDIIISTLKELSTFNYF